MRRVARTTAPSARPRWTRCTRMRGTRSPPRNSSPTRGCSHGRCGEVWVTAGPPAGHYVDVTGGLLDQKIAALRAHREPDRAPGGPGGNAARLDDPHRGARRPARAQARRDFQVLETASPSRRAASFRPRKQSGPAGSPPGPPSCSVPLASRQSVIAQKAAIRNTPAVARTSTSTAAAAASPQGPEHDQVAPGLRVLPLEPDHLPPARPAAPQSPACPPHGLGMQIGLREGPVARLVRGVQRTGQFRGIHGPTLARSTDTRAKQGAGGHGGKPS